MRPASRIPPWLVLTLLAGIVAVQGVELWAWAARDALPARSICCDLSVDAAAAVARVHREGAGPAPDWRAADGLLTPLAQRLFDATGSVDAFQWTIGLFAIGLSLALFDLGRALGGAPGGLLAAALSPWVPLMAFMGRRWDTQGPLAAVVAVGVAAVVRSRGLRRPLPVAWACAALGACLVLSPRPTDNLLAAGTLGAVVLAAAARTLVTGRGPHGERVRRRAPLIALAVLAVGLAIAFPHLPLTTSPEGAAYYARQAAQGASGAGTVGGWVGASAYATHLFWRGLTPLWAAPLWVAGVAFSLRGRGRAEVLTWALLPLLVLSALPKRNYYYLSAAWPAVPLLLALGIRALPGGRGAQALVATALLAAGAIHGASPGARSRSSSSVWKVRPHWRVPVSQVCSAAMGSRAVPPQARSRCCVSPVASSAVAATACTQRPPGRARMPSARSSGTAGHAADR